MGAFAPRLQCNIDTQRRDGDFESEDGLTSRPKLLHIFALIRSYVADVFLSLYWKTINNGKDGDRVFDETFAMVAHDDWHEVSGFYFMCSIRLTLSIDSVLFNFLQHHMISYITHSR